MTLVGEREPFVQMLEAHLGRTLAPQVRNAFLQVPRHFFVQQYYRKKGNSPYCDLVQATPEQIYQDEALVTQIDARGMPTSSTSQPSVMAAQLEALALAPGQRVLEIGVGTGYNAALLGAMAGDTGQVISIDIDEDLVEQAKRHLTVASVKNVIALPGDGFLGEATYAPYDRIIATCGIRSVPRPWFEQLKPGGRFVGNWILPLASLFVAASKTSTGELEGALLDLEATYMEMHTKGMRPSKQKIDWEAFDTHPVGRIELPNALTWLQNPAYTLLLQCLFPQMGKRYRSRNDQIQLYLLTRKTAIQVEEDHLLLFGDDEVRQTIQQSFDLYQQLGLPQITEYRVTLQEQQAVIYVRDRYFHFSTVS